MGDFRFHREHREAVWWMGNEWWALPVILVLAGIVYFVAVL